MIYVLSGGGSGGTLEVTAPAGVTVTATKSGKTYTRTTNAQGKAVFKGLASGTWQLSISDGSQTSTPVSVMIEADYTVTLAFFSATINITYPAGAVCTATDGTTTFTAPNTGGTWALTVPNAGTWTIACSTQATGQSKSAQVVISAEGESKSVTLSYSLTLLSGTDQCTSVTGGWVADDIVMDASVANYYGCQAPTVTWGSNGVTLKPNKSGSLRTNQAINLSSFTTLTWTPSVETYSTVFLFTAVPNSGAVSNVLAEASTAAGALDVSNINENCYIGINVSNSGQPNTTINNIVLS